MINSRINPLSGGVQCLEAQDLHIQDTGARAATVVKFSILIWEFPSVMSAEGNWSEIVARVQAGLLSHHRNPVISNDDANIIKLVENLFKIIN